MRVSILGNSRHGLARGVAVLALAALAAGCSSGAERFTDGLVTSSTSEQQQRAARQQPQVQAEPDLVMPSGDATYSSNTPRVERGSLPPVAGTKTSDKPFQRADDEEYQEAAATVPRQPAIDPMSSATERAGEVTTGSVRKDPAGWSSANGTTVTAREGETVYNLSRRYGVPAKVLTQVNGLDASGNLHAGQKVVIPTYMYSERAPVSAPDNDPKVADAKSSRGVRNGEPLKAQELPEPKDIAGNKPQKAQSGIYVVEPGDSLLGIARDNGVTMAAIRSANGMENDNLRIGQKLKIPGGGAATTVAKAETPKVQPKAVASAGKTQKAVNGVYVVEPGDSLLGIARDNGVTMAAIRSANGMESDSLRVGQKLKMPGAGSATVAKATVSEPKPVKETARVEKVAAVEKPKPAKVAKAEPKVEEVDPQKTASTGPAKKEQAAAAVKDVDSAPQQVAAVKPAAPAQDDDADAGGGKLRWPVKGRVVSNYGKGGGSSRDGIDIQVPAGTPVKAAEGGVVIYAGNGLKDFGNTVLVRHDNGLVTVYGHADSLKVKRGQTVKRGEQIATAGMSGSADAPKLHFEVRKDASPVDPSGYLQ